MNHPDADHLNQVLSAGKFNASEMRLIGLWVTHLLVTGIYKIGKFHDEN